MRTLYSLRLQLVFFLAATITASTQVQGLQVEFAEDDVSVPEGAGPLVVEVDVFGLQENDNVTVELIPMTIADFLSTHQDLPSGAMNINPAESSDFNSSVHTVLLTSNGGTRVEIEIFDDNIAELVEVFLVVLNVVNISSGDSLEDGRNVLVARIRMDSTDMATIEFSEVGFSFPENAGNVSEVRVVKTGEIEDPILITVQLQPFGDQATQGVDFDLEVESGNLQLVFDPNFESLTVNFTIMEDLLPETVERFQLRLDGSSLVQLILGTNTTTTISIVDNDPLTVGFDQQTLELEEGQRDEICVVLLQPDAIQFFLDLTISIDLQGSATEDQFDLDAGCISPNTVRKYDLTLSEGVTSCCFTVTTMNDDTLEESRVFTIKVEEDSLSPSNPLLTLEPDVVTVTITDNDGTPSAPINLEAELVNDNKDLLITWDADLTDPLRPIDRFLVRVNISSEDSGVEMREFDTVDTQFTISDIDPDKQYTIVVCSINTFGENCTDPLSPVIVPPPAGPPNAPTNLEAELVNDNKDLLITWDADLTDPLRPIDQFLVRVNISSETMQDSGVEMREFDTNDTQYTISDIDPDKQYTIVVCSVNTFGENCTDPLSLSPVIVPPPAGPPSAPTNLEAELVNDDKDLLITWDADLTDPLRPIDRFLVRVNISSEDSGVEMREFDTNDTQYTISDIDPDKQYTIVVCSVNTFGDNCTDPLSPVTPGAFTTDSGLEPGIIALIVILAFLLALLCCILLIILLFCLIKKRRRRYYQKREKKYAKEHEEES